MATQKVALITAGTAGLGAQVARMLAPDFRIAINYANNADRAKALLDELHQIPPNTNSSANPRFEAIRADVGDRSAIQRLVEETTAKFGRLDVVVSNAGWTRITNFSNLDEGMVEEDWPSSIQLNTPVLTSLPDKCFLYNVKAHLWLLHAAKPALTSTAGTFITTASLAGVKPSGSSLPYSVTKAATIHLTKALAVICGPAGIRCNSVSPGLILTEWGMKFDEEKREKARAGTKLGRLATVEDCADAVRMMALNKSMTGQNMLVDSGTSV